MPHSLLPLLRQAAACAGRVFGTFSARFAVIVAIVVAVAGSARAATPFEVRVAMSPAGRHFIMLDDPAWFETTLEAFVQ